MLNFLNSGLFLVAFVVASALGAPLISPLLYGFAVPLVAIYAVGYMADSAEVKRFAGMGAALAIFGGTVSVMINGAFMSLDPIAKVLLVLGALFAAFVATIIYALRGYVWLKKNVLPKPARAPAARGRGRRRP